MSMTGSGQTGSEPDLPKNRWSTLTKPCPSARKTQVRLCTGLLEDHVLGQMDHDTGFVLEASRSGADTYQHLQ